MTAAVADFFLNIMEASVPELQDTGHDDPEAFGVPVPDFKAHHLYVCVV